MINKIIHSLLFFICFSWSSFLQNCNAMNAEVANFVDLSYLGGHAIVPRPLTISAPDDLGKEDLLLQDILQKAMFSAVRMFIDRGQDISTRNVVLNICKALSNHEISSSAAATLFSHIIKQRHIWTIPSNTVVGWNADLHYLSWSTAIRIFEEGIHRNIPNGHSSFLINEDTDTLDFFRELLIAINKSVNDNIKNIIISYNANSIFIDILNIHMDKPILFAHCNPSAVAGLIPADQGDVAGLARLRTMLPHGGRITNQMKADSIRDIADCIGENGEHTIVVPQAFPVLENGFSASVTNPQKTNTIRFCINTPQAEPYIASMYPLPK